GGGPHGGFGGERSPPLELRRSTAGAPAWRAASRSFSTPPSAARPRQASATTMCLEVRHVFELLRHALGHHRVQPHEPPRIYRAACHLVVELAVVLLNSKTRNRARLSIVAVVALVALSALGLKGANAEHRAHLSLDLLEHQSRHTLTPARVIVHGSDSEIDAIAGRHHLQIVRR